MIPAVNISSFFAAPFPGDAGFPSTSQKNVAVLVDEICSKTSSLRLTGMPHEACFRKMMKQASLLFAQSADVKENELMQFDLATKQGYVHHGAEKLQADGSGDPKEVCLFSWSC